MTKRPAERLEDVFDRIHRRGADGEIKLGQASDTCWDGEFRYTKNPHNPDGPDQSVVFYSVAGRDPDEIITELLDAFETWWSVDENR